MKINRCLKSLLLGVTGIMATLNGSHADSEWTFKGTAQEFLQQHQASFQANDHKRLREWFHSLAGAASLNRMDCRIAVQKQSGTYGPGENSLLKQLQIRDQKHEYFAYQEAGFRDVQKVQLESVEVSDHPPIPPFSDRKKEWAADIKDDYAQGSYYTQVCVSKKWLKDVKTTRQEVLAFFREQGIAPEIVIFPDADCPGDSTWNFEAAVDKIDIHSEYHFFEVKAECHVERNITFSMDHHAEMIVVKMDQQAASEKPGVLVTDSSNQTVFSIEANGLETQIKIPVGNLADGMYTISVRSSDPHASPVVSHFVKR